jgi:uncharacterized protein (TIGR00369 family)
MPSIPSDFEPHFRKSPVTDPWEPLYSRRRADAVDILFEVRPAHCNSRGFLHGGVLASLCDNAMGLSLAASLSDPSPHIVTINLSVDYLDGAKLGDSVVIEPRVVRSGGSIGFCDAMVKVGTANVARAHATFKVRSSLDKTSLPQ